MKSFFLYIDGRYLEITPTSYVLPVGTDNNGNAVCAIGIVSSGDSNWLLGDVFLKNFFSVWDDDNGKIRFAPHKHTTSTIVAGNKPATLYENSATTENELLYTFLQYLIYIVMLYIG